MEEALAAERAAREQVTHEYQAVSRQESKLLSAMQPDAQRLRTIERRGTFDKTLGETIAYLKTRPSDKREMEKMLKSTFPEFSTEIDKSLNP